MLILIVGLVLFLGVHSIRIFAETKRANFIARYSHLTYKGLYTAVSLAGLGLILWGYGISRTAPVDLWWPPIWTRHVAALLMLLSMILLVSAYVPGNRIKAALGHPMLVGVKVWAIAHLLSNGRLADMLLFGAFLVWAVLSFKAARQRDRLANIRYPTKGWAMDVLTVLTGGILWWVFAFYLHGWLIGVKPFG